MKNDYQPKIRFSGYANERINLEFADVFDRVKSYSLSRSVETNENTGLKYVHYGDIHTKVADKINNESKIPNIQLRNYDTLQKGDLILADASEDYQGIAMPSVILDDTEFNIIAGLHTIALRPKEADSLYLYYLIKASTFRRHGYKTGTGMKVFGISLSNVLKFKTSLPTNEEQQKIGEFFKNLDDRIALQQRQIELLKESKQGFLQKMFPKDGEREPEVRFVRFNDDWKQIKLRDTNSFFTDGNYGESYPKESEMSNKYEGVPFLRGSNLKNGKLLVKNANYITKEKHSELTSGHLEFDDIVIAVRGSLGALGYVNRENVDWNINSQLAIIRTDKIELYGHFLIQYLLSDKGQKELLSKNTGTALKQLPIKQLKDVTIQVPSINEQQKIGQFFKQLDDNIALHEKELELLKETKKGFLQKMFV